MKREKIVGIKTETSEGIEILKDSEYIVLNPRFINDALKKINNMGFGPLKQVYPFYDGYMIYEKKVPRFESRVWGYMDLDGKTKDIINTEGLEYVPGGYFMANFWYYTDTASGVVKGLFNTKGINVTFGKDRLLDCLPFSEGLAPAKFLDKYGCFWTYIDENGNYDNRMRYGAASVFVDGEGLVYDEGRWYFVDRNGSFISYFKEIPFEAHPQQYMQDVKERVTPRYGNDVSLNMDGCYVHPVDNETGIPILFKPILNEIISKFSLPKRNGDFRENLITYFNAIARRGTFAVDLRSGDILPTKLYTGERIYDDFKGFITVFDNQPLERSRKKRG